ncbi:MAG: SPOR domain-containing protein [Gammaproteobacteria bacterium]|nr:SPOR domain-containing protein [Gammaproteobacteria bacterium]
MQERTKQRLIGILVVVGALFFIMSFLFHNAQPTVASQDANMNSAATPAVAVALPANQTIAQNQNNTPSVPLAPSAANATTADANVTTNATTAINAAAAANANTTDNSNNTAAVAPPAANISNTTSPVPAQLPTAAIAHNPVASATTPAAIKLANNVVQPAAPTPTPTPTSAVAFANSPTALTTGQANEGPAQPMLAANVQAQPQAQPAADIVATAKTPIVAESAVKPFVKKQVVAKREERKHSQNLMLVKREERKHAQNVMLAKKEWHVQLGVFSDKANAKQLMAKLRHQHLNVYAHHVEHGHKSLMAIYVGPEKNKMQAQRVQKHLRAEFKIDGIVKQG